MGIVNSPFKNVFASAMREEEGTKRETTWRFAAEEGRGTEGEGR